MDSDFIATSAEYVAEFYAQLKLLDDFFSKHKIKFWAIGGTLLGQVRGGAFIPWDDDNDVGIFEKDGDYVFKHLQDDLQKQGGTHDVWKSVHGLKFFSKTLSHAGTDIFFYKERADACDIFELASEKSRKQWPHDYFLGSELIGDLPRGNFGPITIPIPRNAERQLKKVYGEKCLTHAKLAGFCHLTNSARVGKQKEVEINKISIKEI